MPDARSGPPNTPQPPTASARQLPRSTRQQQTRGNSASCPLWLDVSCLRLLVASCCVLCLAVDVAAKFQLPPCSVAVAVQSVAVSVCSVATDEKRTRDVCGAPRREPWGRAAEECRGHLGNVFTNLGDAPLEPDFFLVLRRLVARLDDAVQHHLVGRRLVGGFAE